MDYYGDHDEGTTVESCFSRLPFPGISDYLNFLF